MTITDDLHGIAHDLHQINDMLRWSITQAWWPTSRAFDAPPGRALPPIDPDQPDHIPGPRYALGVGDHSAQQAITTAHRHLRAAESELYLTYTLLVLSRTVPARVPVRRLEPDRIIGLVTELRWLTTTLDRTPPPTSTKHRVRRARNEIDRAWRTLDAAMGRTEADPHTHATAAKDRCRVCEIRPVRLTAKGRAKKDGRCETCAKWWQRNGFERPSSLDPIHEARRAQAARLKRGEGWGDESFSGTTAGERAS